MKLDQQSRIPVNIVRQTSTRLTLRSLTWLPWFVGVCFVAIGAFTGSQVGEKVSLDCSRESPGYCTFTSVGWFARHTKTFPVLALQQARLERLEADEDAFGYRVILILQDETLPFTQIATSDSKNHYRRMTAINQFIQTPAQISLKVRADNRWIGVVIFSFLGGAGLLVILTNTVVTCDFDQAANQFTLCRWNLLGATTYERPLHQFLGLRLEESIEPI